MALSPRNENQKRFDSRRRKRKLDGLLCRNRMICFDSSLTPRENEMILFLHFSPGFYIGLCRIWSEIWEHVIDADVDQSDLEGWCGHPMGVRLVLG